MGESSTRRAGLRLLAGILALCGVLLGVLPSAGAAEERTPATAARLGAAWLGTQLRKQIPLDLFGSPDWGVTVDAATALAAVDAADPLIATVWDALVANRDTVVSDGTADVPGSLAKVILLAHATGHDPRAVGSGPGADLVERLAATLQPSGLYGTQFAGYDGVYRQGLAITALVAAGGTVDPSAIAWLVDQQCTNTGFEGAFMPFRADTSADCFDDPANWLGADTNAAAMAVTALTFAAKDDPTATETVEAALTWLAGVRDADGGWASNSWSGPDANSTAVVVQSLIAADRVTSPEFSGGTATPFQFLMTLQAVNQDDQGDDGVFNYMAGPVDPNLLATVQAVVALASKPLIFEGSVPDVPDVPVDGNDQATGDGTVDTTTRDDSAATSDGSTAVMGAAAVAERGIGFTG